MMDDQALLGASDAKVDSVLARMQAFGADRLRVSAFWSDIAPAPHSTKPPARFDPSYPYAPEYRFGDLDRVVGLAAKHGMKVLISVSTPIPYWASRDPSKKNPVWMPEPEQFARFAYAVAARYGQFADQFAILNEPNQGAWLQPQSLGGKPVSPHVYAALARSGYAAVKMAAPNATVLVGELAPSGRNDPGVTRPIRPLEFLRENGLVIREDKGTVPPHVEYRLSDVGRSLSEALNVLDRWAETNFPALDAARERYDAERASGTSA